MGGESFRGVASAVMPAALAVALLLLLSLLGSALAQALWQWLLLAMVLLLGSRWVVHQRSLARIQAFLLLWLSHSVLCGEVWGLSFVRTLWTLCTPLPSQPLFR